MLRYFELEVETLQNKSNTVLLDIKRKCDAHPVISGNITFQKTRFLQQLGVISSITVIQQIMQ